MGIAARSHTVAAQRRTRAVQLATLGLTYEEMAHQVGYRNRGTAYRAVRRELDRHSLNAVEHHRQIEMERLDALQRALWDRAMSDEISAGNTVLKIIQARIRLLGLDRPHSEEHTDDGATVVLSLEQLQAWLEINNGSVWPAPWPAGATLIGFRHALRHRLCVASPVLPIWATPPMR